MSKAQALAMLLILNDLTLPTDLVATLINEGCLINEFEDSILEGEIYEQARDGYYPTR